MPRLPGGCAGPYATHSADDNGERSREQRTNSGKDGSLAFSPATARPEGHLIYVREL